MKPTQLLKHGGTDPKSRDTAVGQRQNPRCPRRVVRRHRVEPQLKAEPKLTTHGCAIFWYDHGCPNEIGKTITADMQSGRQAIYKLTNIRHAHGTDWDWYDFDFVDYLKSPNQ